MADFAKAELDELVHSLWIARSFETSPVVLLGALVMLARRLPLEVVEALIPVYIEREREELKREIAGSNREQ